jgi:alpha-glucosidase
MMVGEVYLLKPGQTATYLGEPEDGELHLSFDFRPVHTRWDAAAMATAIDAGQAEFADADGRWPTWVLSNHDQPRHRTRFGSDAAARAAAVLSLTVRGTPFLYAGEELGLEDADVPTERVVDPGGRDGCRAPIPWLAAGSADEGHGWPVPPWLPFPANASTAGADVEEADPSSMLHLYRRLLTLRRSSDCLRRGTMSPVRGDGDVIRFDRSFADCRIRVVINFGQATQPLDADECTGDVLLSTNARSAGSRDVGADEALVIQI